MKNKIAYLLFFVVAVAMAMAGCNKKFLEDMKSYDRYDESIFTSETQTGWYIDRLYNFYFSAYRNPTLTVVGLYNDTRSSITEEIGGQSKFPDYINPLKTLQFASQADAYYGTALPDKVVNDPFTRIRNANFLIQKMDSAGAETLSADFRKTAKGQMYFLRALQYFDLVRIYGGVPIVLDVNEADPSKEEIKLPRARSSEVFDQIVKDFDSAAALLPKIWTNTGSDYGRFTSGAALAMKSRVLLTAASPLFNANWDNPGDAKWQKALDASLAADVALTAAGYGGSVNTAKAWAEASYTFDKGAGISPTAQGEGIFIIPLSNSNAGSGVINSSWENTIRPKSHNGGGGISAPKGMIDMFPLADGRRPTTANGYNDKYFFENRDPRFYRTFAFSGSKWPFASNPNKTTWLYRWRESASKSASYFGNNQVSSPAIVRKMSNPNVDSTGFNFSGTDILDYRYGELLLNIAECYAATGQIDKCIDYLGKIRKRVGIPAANNYGIGTLGSKYAALEACLYERRVELAYEGKRFWDLQRWMLYDDEGTDNTNAVLGIPKLNGTNRTGYYWELQNYTKNDALTDADRNISIDPDASNFGAQIAALKALFDAKFKMTQLDQIMDRDGTTPVNMLFRSNYYISGLTSTILSYNPWLTQTKGWQDYNGAMGTFDYQQ